MRPRGRPARGSGVTRDIILSTALTLLDEGGGQGLSMRALGARLGVTPMSLYHHVEDLAGLLRALSDNVYAEVLAGVDAELRGRAAVEAILTRYHQAVRRHPQLTLAIFATPEAFAGVTREITDRLTASLADMTDAPLPWRDILVDHAHGSALPFSQTGSAQQTAADDHYRHALGLLLDRLTGIPA